MRPLRTVLSAILAVPAVAVGQPATPAASTPSVPCPAPQVSRPERPTPPPRRPEDQAVGGAALATPGLTIPAGTPEPASLTAVSWLVADLDSGAVIGGCGPHEYGTPASVQKLLLAATMMPKLDPARVIEVTPEDMDFEPGSSAMGLIEGGHYSIETLWLGLLLNSGNDAANVLARVGGGPAGRTGGIEAMNAKARRLGAYQTHAVTPSGLDGAGQFTSAYDLALIARACYAREDFRRYVSTQQAKVPAQPAKGKDGFTIQNDNKLLTQYPGMLGGKTGFTDIARQTYVGVAERDGRRLVVTILGAENGLYGEATSLLDWGFRLPRDASVGRLVAPDEAAPTPSSSGGPLTVDPRAGTWAETFSPVALTGLAVAGAGVLLFFLVMMGRRIAAARTAAGGRSRTDEENR